MGKTILKNLLAIFIGFTIAVIIFEITLRIWQPIKFRVKGNTIILPVNQKLVINNDEIYKLDKKIIVSRNSLGFRGENPPKEFINYITIVTVGGSTTEDIYLSDNKTWTDDLGNMLKKSYKKIWINNAGIDGCSTFGHIILLKDYIVKLKPKIVIFLVGVNDIGLEDYRRADNRIIIKNRFKDLNLSFIKKKIVLILDKIETYQFMVNLSRYWKGVKMNVQHKKYYDLCRMKDKYILDSKILALIQLHNNKYINGYQNRLEELIKICKDNHIIPIFITQPALYGQGIDVITGKNLETLEYGNINGKAAWELMELYNETLRQVVSSNGLLLIDLAREMPKNYKYYYDVHHFTNEGAERVAEIVYQKLFPFMATRFKEYKIGRKQ